MSEAIWIAIITTWIVVIAALLIGYWQVRTMRAIANPQQKQLNPRIKDALISFAFVIFAAILFVVGSFYPFYILFYASSNDAPMTRDSVIKISILVWLICFNFVRCAGLAAHIIKKEIKWQWEQYKDQK